MAIHSTEGSTLKNSFDVDRCCQSSSKLRGDRIIAVSSDGRGRPSYCTFEVAEPAPAGSSCNLHEHHGSCVESRSCGEACDILTASNRNINLDQRGVPACTRNCCRVRVR